LVACAICGCDGSKNLSKEEVIRTELSDSAAKRNASFDDITAKVGLDHSFRNGEEADELSILETIGGGVAVIDYDRDGFEDLFFPGGGGMNNKTITGLAGSLWRNREGKKYENVTALARTDLVSNYTHGATSGDLNDDGFSDILVTGYNGLQLFMNQGDGTFMESAQQAGIQEDHWSTSAAFGDFNSDGYLDIYVTHYVDWSWTNHPPCKSLGVKDVCPPGNFTGISDVIFVNNGNGTFNPKSTEFGLLAEGKGLGVMVADLTQDSKVDIYVANDTTNNFFYENLGGTFREIGLPSGTAVDDAGTPQGSMGLCTLDYDQDLLPDIWVCNYESQAFALYKNDGKANFRYVTATTGLMALGTTYVAFGTTTADFDLDGDEDIVVTNGHVMRFRQGGGTADQNPLFLTNSGAKRFARQSFSDSEYFGKKWRGRGVVSFDVDRDGDLDLTFSHVNQPVVLLENTTRTTGNWWILELVGTVSNRDAIGARVVFKSTKRSCLRNVVGGGSYLSQNPYSLHLGLPADEKLLQAEIFWPSGTTQLITEFKPNSRMQVVEPSHKDR